MAERSNVDQDRIFSRPAEPDRTELFSSSWARFLAKILEESNKDVEEIYAPWNEAGGGVLKKTAISAQIIRSAIDGTFIFKSVLASKRDSDYVLKCLPPDHPENETGKHLVLINIRFKDYEREPSILEAYGRKITKFAVNIDYKARFPED